MSSHWASLTHTPQSFRGQSPIIWNNHRIANDEKKMDHGVPPKDFNRFHKPSNSDGGIHNNHVVGGNKHYRNHLPVPPNLYKIHHSEPVIKDLPANEANTRYTYHDRQAANPPDVGLTNKSYLLHQ